MMTVSDLMTREVVTLLESDEVGRAERLLAQRHIRHLPVVRGGKLVGLVTHRDIIRAHAQAREGKAGDVLWAEDIMTRHPRAVSPETSVREALQQILDHKWGCLPVVDESGLLVGIVTEADFVRLCDGLIRVQDLRETAAEYEADA
jgi:CBS domain-containing protein